jgi:hypothetical protein
MNTPVNLSWRASTGYSAIVQADVIFEPIQQGIFNPPVQNGERGAQKEYHRAEFTEPAGKTKAQNVFMYFV